MPTSGGRALAMRTPAVREGRTKKRGRIAREACEPCRRAKVKVCLARRESNQDAYDRRIVWL